MKKTNNKKGFTLAELLVVVAIIAVLVAISIPIFTAQLEKSREATDEANLRALYAECTSAVLMEDNTTDTNANPKVTTTEGVTTAVGTYTMTQKKDGFASGATSIKIGNVTITNTQFTTGTATVTVTSDGNAKIEFAK